MILAGISVGLESAVYAALIVAAAVYGVFLLGGGITVLSLFAVALAGTGLLTTVGVIVAMDTFGPVSDNAQGIAEMSGDVTGEGAVVLTQLDAVGNTTKAITKGIAIATAVLAATALFGSFTSAISDALAKAGTSASDVTGITAASLSTDVTSPNVIVGAIIGAAVVFFFSGLLISAVARAAGAVVYEVRRQFREIVGIMEGTALPEYGKVVDIVTRDSLRELATPGLMAVLAPIATGFALGVGALAGYLVGAIAAGALMAVFLANSGGAWDNAKKLVEEGQSRRQGLARPRGDHHRRHGRRPLQGHRRPGYQPAAQGDEPRRLADRAADRPLLRRRAPQRAVAHHHRRGGVRDHRGVRGDLQAPQRRGRRRARMIRPKPRRPHWSSSSPESAAVAGVSHPPRRH